MHKMKTNRGAMKRFKKLASGKIKRMKAYKSHILTKKSTKRKRGLRTATLVFPGEMRRVKRMIGM